MAVVACDIGGRSPIVRLVHALGARGNQERDDLAIAVAGRGVQRRHAAAFFRVRIGAARQQEFDDRRISGGDRGVQRGDT